LANMSLSPDRERTVAELIAEYLVAQGVARIYGLCGGHIQEIWDAADRMGIAIVDVRHEGAAVLMAQGEAEVTGRLGVAMVTAGPGLTNGVTGIANAFSSHVPLLVLSGRPPRPQAGMGAMQELPQTDIVRSVCRYAGTASERHHVLPRLDAAVAAAEGDGDPPGPAYLDFPADLLTENVGPADLSPFRLTTSPRPVSPPNPTDLEAARQLIASARRTLVIAGRGVREAGRELVEFLDRSGSLYLDTQESRGALPADHPAGVPAMRRAAMREADLVITLGRRLNYQLGYGSPALFASDARFLRIGTSSAETSDNRRGDVELRCTPAAALSALSERKAIPTDPDREWAEAIQAKNAARASKLRTEMASRRPGRDGHMHPHRLVAAINEQLTPDTVVVVDGGDILSFARLGLADCLYLDPGPLGCLGVGVPYATAAALAAPERRVIALIGDGSFGFTAMEVDTAARHGAKAVFVVANNAAWNIERNDQTLRYGGNHVGADLPDCRYDELAQSLGVNGRHVTDPEELPAALEWALANAPAVLDVTVTQDAESPDFTGGLAVVHARQALTAWHEAEEARHAPVSDGASR
jgi:acetolactate synthase I/II/III large subunit